MGYVIALIILVLIVAGIAGFMVMSASRRSDVSDAQDPGREGSPSMFGSESDAPVGDTRQHAGEQTEHGETVGDQDAERHGGTGSARGYGGSGEIGSGREPDPERVARPVVGGEGEGERSA